MISDEKEKLPGGQIVMDNRKKKTYLKPGMEIIYLEAADMTRIRNQIDEDIKTLLIGQAVGAAAAAKG